MANPTVYVIDDCRLALAAVEALLAAGGYRARCFLSPRGFLADRSRTRGDCVVADMNMADLAPASFLHRLRAQGSRLPVVMTGLYVAPSQAQAWLQRGAYAVLEKPFDGNVFLETIAQARQAPAYATLCSSLLSLAQLGPPATSPPTWPRQ